ncbi:hypothetical protein [Ilumatobacter sp.]|uniref:hypothetical protein n=2 Tax=Ilumatobacter sp. TaxID=1967498 RepID=UPI00329A25AC
MIRLMRHKWQPVGSNVMPAAETEHLVRHLFAGDDGRRMAHRIDRRIDRLPGLDGLRLVDAVRRTVHPRTTSVSPGVAPVRLSA